jgi:hypothetical protein
MWDKELVCQEGRLEEKWALMLETEKETQMVMVLECPLKR